MEKVTIANIGRKQQPSRYKPGQTYLLTTIQDSTGRILTAFGDWAKDWQIGQTIEGNVTSKQITDQNGMSKTVHNIEDPNKKEFGKFGPKNYWPDAYKLAIEWVLQTKDNPTLNDLDPIALIFKERMENGMGQKLQDRVSNQPTGPVGGLAAPSANPFDEQL